MISHETYYQAVLTRDHRFDGKFFVAVKTTGVYCRPICPARAKPENIEFFKTAQAAELAGYRPCLRCRPEAARGSPAWNGTHTTVERALKLMAQGALKQQSEDALADRLGMRSAGAWLVAAAGWTSGSMLPPGQPEVPVSPALTGDAVGTALKLAAARDPLQFDQRMQTFVQRALTAFAPAAA